MAMIRTMTCVVGDVNLHALADEIARHVECTFEHAERGERRVRVSHDHEAIADGRIEPLTKVTRSCAIQHACCRDGQPIVLRDRCQAADLDGNTRRSLSGTRRC